MAEVSLVMKGVDATSGVIDGVASAISGLGAIAATVAATGLAALGAGLAVSFTAALDNEKIQAELAQTIKSTGGEAGLTADAANELAAQFMHLAGGSDDAILAIETIGLRAGTISANEMPDFIQATLDLGTVMGDTAGAATLLARAQDDPEAAFKRIERATGAYDSALEEQIKTLVAAGDNAGAVELIMAKLAETTGGAAAAQAETLSGQWEILKGTLGEAAESIGMSLLPVAKQLFEDVLAPMIPVITDLGAQFGYFFDALFNGGDAFEVLYEAFDILSNAFPGLSGQIHAIQAAFAGAWAFIQEQTPLVIAAIQPVIDAAGNLLKAFQDSLPMIQTYFADMVAFVLAQVDILAPTLIANVTTMLDGLAEFWRNHGDTVMGIVNFAWRTIVVTIGGALTWLSGILAATMQIINGDWEGAWQTIKDTAATFMESVLSIVGTDLETFNATWAANWEMAKLIVTTVWTQIKDAVAAKVMEITSGIQTAIINTIVWLREFLPIFIQVGRDIIGAITEGVVSAALNLAAAVISAVTGALGAVGGVVGGGGGGGTVSNTVNNTSNSTNQTNNFYGVGADLAAGAMHAQAGAF